MHAVSHQGSPCQQCVCPATSQHAPAPARPNPVLLPQLATVRTDGRPAVRTVVFRGFHNDSNMLTFNTDTRRVPAALCVPALLSCHARLLPYAMASLLLRAGGHRMCTPVHSVP